MPKIVKIIGIFGFVACLGIMYLTDHGIRGIKKYDSSFRLLDMRFHYNTETVVRTLKGLNEGGRRAYGKFLCLDFVFIACFLVTMLTVTEAISLPPLVKGILFALCFLRALFDILENTFLLFLLSRYPSVNEVPAFLCSWFTTLKFIMLYLWFAAVIWYVGKSFFAVYQSHFSGHQGSF